MTQDFLNMIYLFSCGSLGITPIQNHELNITEIRKHAISQGVWPTVVLALKKLFDEGKLNVDTQVFNSLKFQTIISVTANKKRLSAIHDLLEQFESAGIRYCILKGEGLSLLYHNPDFRISNDTDILIDSKDQKKAVSVLLEFGFDVKPLNPTSHHIVAIHPVAGLAELHLHLHDELFEDVWFDNKMLNCEQYRSIQTSDGKHITVLGITDGLIFTTLHYIKHFLSCGVGIRQLMDVLLYIKAYHHQIDWKRFHELMEYLKFNKFMDATMGIGVKFLNFQKEDFPRFSSDDTVIEKVLYDIEKSGVFGRNENERDGFYLHYTKARFSRFKNENYNTYIKKWWRPNFYKIVFPPFNVLARKFPYVYKIPALYLVAWFHRYINFIFEFGKKEKNLAAALHPGEGLEENDIVKKRMDLIRELDMI